MLFMEQIKILEYAYHFFPGALRTNWGELYVERQCVPKCLIFDDFLHIHTHIIYGHNSYSCIWTLTISSTYVTSCGHFAVFSHSSLHLLSTKQRATFDSKLYMLSEYEPERLIKYNDYYILIVKNTYGYIHKVTNPCPETQELN